MTPIPCEYTDTLMTVANVNVTLGGAPILRDVNLEIKDLHRPGFTQGQVVGLLGPSGIGKAQPLDAGVLTPNGFVPMGSLRRGDFVIGSDGRPTKVLGVFPQGVKPVHRVTLSDGSSTECCDEHLWYTETCLDRAARSGRGRPGTVKSLREIRGSLTDSWGKRNHSVPLVGPVGFHERPLPIDPYLMGLLLGDGGLAGPTQIRLTSVEPDILASAAERLPVGYRVNPVSSGKAGIDYRLAHEDGRKNTGRGHFTNPLLNALREMGLMGCRSYEKFIPDQYLVNSVDNRVALLRGLMDTDGYRGAATQLSTSSEELAKGVQYLVQSLGGTTRTHVKSPRYVYKGEQRTGKAHYTITLCLPNEIMPFGLLRKSSRVVARSRYPVRRYVEAITPAGNKECQCILVEAPDHLYVTDDFILTHNTTLFRILAGLESPDSGTVLIDKECRPVQRGMVGVVAQNYPLFAHRTVKGNLTVAGRQAGLSGAAAAQQAGELLRRFDLAEHAAKYPVQLSGGQRQRVAIAQQLLCSDHFLLMDEPFSGLDLIAAERVSDLICELAQSDELKTFIIVTHDIGAAIQVCDTLVLLGRDRDAEGNIIPGARVQATYNLVERGLAWQKGITTTPEFLVLLQEIRKKFPLL